MKFLFVILILISASIEPDLDLIRNLYPYAFKSEAKLSELSAQLTSVNVKSDELMIAYKGAAMTLRSRSIKKISDKMAMFKDGVKFIELAVRNDSSNVEIRFVRFTVQENVPEVVKYKMNLLSDKNFILKNYVQQSAFMQNYFKAYLQNSKSLTSEEKGRLN